MVPLLTKTVCTRRGATFLPVAQLLLGFLGTQDTVLIGIVILYRPMITVVQGQPRQKRNAAGLRIRGRLRALGYPANRSTQRILQSFKPATEIKHAVVDHGYLAEDETKKACSPQKIPPGLSPLADWPVAVRSVSESTRNLSKPNYPENRFNQKRNLSKRAIT